MKKIVFVNPPLSGREQGETLHAAVGRSMPYGLISVAAAARQAGYDVSLIDAANCGYGIQETANRVIGEAPDYVGISAVTVSIRNAASVAAELKLRRSGLGIIVGGVHVSAVPDETLSECEGFDIGVVGEGEQTIIELLRALENGLPLETVHGIVYRSGGKVKRTPPRPFVTDLDSLPMPAWDLLPDMRTFYRLSATSYIRLPAATLVTSRGCPGSCIFCSSKAMFGGLRCFSADYVMGMIAHLIQTYGIRDISIYDDNFIVLKERMRDMCAIIKRNRMKFSWSCYSRVDHGDPELFKLMKDAGCWQISYGIESGSQRILDFARKGVTVAQIEETIENTKKAGLRARGFFIVGHLSEDRESLRDTLKLLLRLRLDDFHITYFTPFPGTKAAEIAGQYGRFERAWEKMNMYYPVFIPSGISRMDMERCSRQAYRRFYLRARILAGYFLILLRYPDNFARLLNGARAVFAMIFSRRRQGEA
jgi:radical SAM superfamily enzyme YgiQ (UPF0313 family)